MSYHDNPVPRSTPDYILTNPSVLRTQVLEFPANPTAGDIYVKHGITYTWSGTHWEANNAKAMADRFTPYNMYTLSDLP
jgi:hypothetical protein